MEPPYVKLASEGVLKRRAAHARDQRRESGCTVCPGECRADRESDVHGDCGIGRGVVVSSVSPHFGEEPCLVGDRGSGTIFFAGCNLRCVFCQNHDVSRHPEIWREIGAHELASFMLSLQARRVENLNLVTPSHVVPEILEALDLAIEAGLRLPIVYNSSAYDAVHTLRLLEGVVSIYMPDFKYGDPLAAKMCSNAPDYPEVAKAAILEMHRQVGDLELDELGIAVRGLLVRHLVLPEGLAGTAEVVRFLAGDVSLRTVVNVMDQYFPAHQARTLAPLSRRVSREEYAEARRLAVEAGLRLVEDLLPAAGGV